MTGFRIAGHPNNLHLTLAALWPDALPVVATFVPYAEGRDTARLLADGAIDLSGRTRPRRSSPTRETGAHAGPPRP